MEDRYFFDLDENNNWYIVRADRRRDWDLWVLNWDASRDELEGIAQPLGGFPSGITFSEPGLETGDGGLIDVSF